jgi:DNA-binding CsgD family transcriptional regulator
MSLRGRSSECALLDDLLSAVRRGESRSLVLRGEAGIGKTALLDYLVESASDVAVARAVGVESEMELAYAGLHQLCGPMLERMVRLPAPQRDGLEVVFGVRAGAAPDRFLVGLAVLGLLSEVAEERPLLCVVDDAQWVDRASALTLGFVARRLLAEPVGLVFAAREPSEELRRVSELRVHGLGRDDAQALLNSALGSGLDERIRDQIIAETRGNPLALLELPRGLTASQLAGGFSLVGARALPGQIEESFVRRLHALSDSGRRLLLLAAAEPTGDPLLLWRAVEQLGIGPTAADELEREGLLAIADRVTFRHPLVRSAMYQSAAPGERRTVHLVLARATDRAVDPDRRAWHLAAAAGAPDEQVALELERSAGRAQTRGGLAATAAFLQRAVALTDDPERLADRALAAAQASLQTGASEAANRMVSTAEAGELDELKRARVDLVRAQIAFTSNRAKDAPALLLAAAKRLEPLDVTLARETYMEALTAAQRAGQFASDAVLKVAEAARLAPGAPSPRGRDLLLDAISLMITQGHAAAAPCLKRALDAFREEDLRVGRGFRWLYLAELVAMELWDYEALRELAVRAVDLIRDAGALAAIPTALTMSAVVRTMAGELATASALIDERKIVTEATGSSDDAPYSALQLAARRGREAELSELIDVTLERAVPRGEGIAVSSTQWARAILCNGLGRYDIARAAAQEVTQPPRRFDQASLTTLPEFIEAAARSGDTEAAHAGLAQFSEAAGPSGSDWGLGLEARCRALLSHGDAAEHLYWEAIERLGRTRVRGEHARAHLLYGEWLRCEGRRVEARGQLRQAHEMLTDMGMEAFAERARGELLAAGEKVRKRTVATRDELTSQERQIAQLASAGLTNPEIGTRLFISPTTVKYHLRKVFTKLEINTRHELAAVLSGDHTIGQPL